MNNLRFQYIVAAVLALLCFSITVPAQPSLPSLAQDKHISKGTLGCGVTYYMVTAPQKKGYADVLIVQRNEPLSASKRDGLSSAFFARMGIGPGPKGYISDEDGSTVYRFTDVPFYKPQVLDSTLLYTFARVAESKAEQAVIVSGDIDAVELKKKMDIFSMLVPRMLVKENHMPDYVWEPSPAPSVIFHPDGEAQVSVTYSGSRIPFAYMNTAQSVVSELFGRELGVLIRHRLERDLKDAGIPHGEIGLRALTSADYSGDERYTVSVKVRREQLDDAMRVISSTIAQLDAFGVKPQEFADAKQVLAPRIYREAASAPSAGEYAQKCIANFLYGGSLAPDSETLRFFARKNVADSTETRLFNNFTSALLEQLSNLTLEYSGVPDSWEKKDDALFYYNLAYLYGSLSESGKDYSWHRADTAGLEVKCPKLRIKSEKREAVTGGTLYTFSNGMRVIFKPVKGTGMFSYALQLGGGLARIPDLSEGEGGYIGDILSLYDVGGLPAPAFRDVLESNGIAMRTNVGLGSMSISGDAPSGKLTLLLKSLLAMANDRSTNISEYQSFCANQQFAGESEREKLYSMLTPGYVYTGIRRAEALTDETRKKADAFYDDRFSRMNDGVLILSGDLSEEGVKRVLLKYLGGFKTLRGVQARKPVQMQTLSGVTTYTAAAGAPGIHVLLDAGYTLTAEHFYTASIAADALQRTLITHLAGYGYSSEVSVDYLAHPQERFRMLVTCRPIAASGLPADVAETSAEQALTAVRAAIKAASLNPVSQADLDAWKRMLDNNVRSVMATPDGFTNTLQARYGENKDLTSRFSETIAGITSEKVQALLGALASGGRIEYLVP